MATKKYHDLALDYTTWYLDHLLKMEDVIGQHLEKKIDKMIDQKIRQYIDGREGN